MRRRLGLTLMISVLLAGGLTVAAPAAEPSPATTFRKDLTVTTRDGIDLPAAFFRPATVAPGRLLPVVTFPHGGGGRRDCPGDVARAEFYAARGYVAILYTARGHGLFPPVEALTDCAQDYRAPSLPGPDIYDVFGPKTVGDLFDVINAVIEDPESHADRNRVALAGYSQGGGTTNLGAAWQESSITDIRAGSEDTEINPYGIRIVAAAPGQSFYDLYRSLAPNECFKLSFGALILGVYYTAAGAVVDPYYAGRWGAAFTSGSIDARDLVRPELTLRSPKTYESDLSAVPSLWVQAFDDNLFPADEAVDWFHEHDGNHRLWLSWGGHATPGSNESEVELRARNLAWFQWLDHYTKGTKNRAESGPRVTYWYMDPEDSTTQYRATASDWPPPAAKANTLYLSAGEMSPAPPATDGETLILNNPALVSDVTTDPIVGFAAQSLPIGSMLPASVRTPADTATYAGPEFTQPRLLAGSPELELNWSSSATEFQTNALLWDVYPDGRRWLISRGCSLQTNTPDLPGEGQMVDLDMFDSARLLAPGHHLELWLSTMAQPTYLASHFPSLNSVNYTTSSPSLLRVPLLTPPKQR